MQVLQLQLQQSYSITPVIFMAYLGLLLLLFVLYIFCYILSFLTPEI